MLFDEPSSALDPEMIKEVFDVIPGSVPNLVNLPVGCRFAPRCRARVNHNLTICTETEPDLIQIGEAHKIRCWLYQDSDQHTAPLKKINSRRDNHDANDSIEI